MAQGYRVRAVLRRYIIACCLLFVPASCYFERGDWYWSGQPQAIGIDFSPTTVTAVLADGLSNFTTLAAITPPTQEYAMWIYAMFEARNTWNQPSILHDDLEETSSELRWLGFKTWVSSMAESASKAACDRLPSVLQDTSYIRGKCFPDWVFDPKPPYLRNKGLIHRNRRLKRLQAMLPKWFRTGQPTRLTKSHFLTVLVDILEELKTAALLEHGVSIKSATISRPNWMYNELSDMLDEACAIAGIESWEQSQDNVDMALSTMDGAGNGTMLLLDHGQYHFDLHYCAWVETAKMLRCQMHVDERRYGSMWILTALISQMIGNFNSNVTDEERHWPQSVGLVPLLREIMAARIQISYGRHWPAELDFQNRTIAVNITDLSGYVRTLNMTGQDVSDVSNLFADKVQIAIERFLASPFARENLQEDMTNLADQDRDTSWGKQQEQKEAMMHNMPAHMRPGFKKIDHILILSSVLDIELLGYAAEMATGQKMAPGPAGMCVPSTEIVARGAALNAQKWQGYWESAMREYSYEYEDDMYDEIEGNWPEEDEERDEI